MRRTTSGRVWGRVTGRLALAGAVAGASALALGACTWTDVRPPAPKYLHEEPYPSAAPPTASASTPPPIEPDEDDTKPPPLRTEVAASQLVATLAGPRMRIADVRGATPDVAGLYFVPVEEPIEACPSRGGVLTVRVATKDGQRVVEVLPGSDVAPETKRCVLQALNAFTPGETMSQSSSPSEALREFSSVLTIQW
ncbi:MAG: hypothetical protein IT373_11730 [Polyangiaceae bacterium]|nr:hypothetical protein [Polyangiaceae bacterium]